MDVLFNTRLDKTHGSSFLTHVASTRLQMLATGQCSRAVGKTGRALFACKLAFLFCFLLVGAEDEVRIEGVESVLNARRPLAEPGSIPGAARVVRRWIGMERPEPPPVTPEKSDMQSSMERKASEHSQADQAQLPEHPDLHSGYQELAELAQMLEAQDGQQETNPFIANRQAFVGKDRKNVVEFLAQIQRENAQGGGAGPGDTHAATNSEMHVPLLDEQQQHEEDGDQKQQLEAQQAQQAQEAALQSDMQGNREERWAALKAHREFITNDTAPAILRRTANRRGQVILLVFHIDRERTAFETLKNWAYHLGNRPPGRPLQHTLMIVPDVASYDLCRQAGLPVYIDRTFPFHFWRSSPWHQEVYHGRNRYFDVAKHWWGLKVTELGYSVLYTDMDMVILRDPLPYLAAQPSASYDVQVQSDSGGPSDSPPGFMLSQPCGIYKLVKEGRAEGGAMMREIWGLRGRDRFTQLQAQTPCASTGFWYIRPTPVAIAFQRMLVDRLLFSLPWGWDQVAWNEVIVAFLVGSGEQPPLRMRLLPLADVANLGTWQNRVAHGLPATPLMIHAAGINGAVEKMAALQTHNYWHPELWDPATLRGGSWGEAAAAAGLGLQGMPAGAGVVAGAALFLMLAAAPLLATWAVRRARRRHAPSTSNAGSPHGRAAGGGGVVMNGKGGPAGGHSSRTA